jgi:hypothetical protein
VLGVRGTGGALTAGTGSQKPICVWDDDVLAPGVYELCVCCRCRLCRALDVASAVHHLALPVEVRLVGWWLCWCKTNARPT